MQKSILPIVLLPSLALALTACGSGEPQSIVLPTPTAAAPIQTHTPNQADTALTQELEKAQNELKALNEKLAEIQKNPADTPAADQPASNAPNQADSALAQKLEKAQNELKAQNAQIEELNKNKQALETQKTELQKQIESKSLEVQTSKTALETVKQELETQKASLASQINALKEQHKAENASKIQELQSALDSKTQELNTVNQNLTQKQAELEKTQKELETLKATVSAPQPPVPVPPPPAPPTSPKEPEPVSISEALKTLKETYKPKPSSYESVVVTIDPSAKSATSDVTESLYYDSMATENLTLGGVEIELLPNDKTEKKLRGVAVLRQMQASDFPNGGLDESRASFVGKTYRTGPNVWDSETGEFRYGVYNAKNGKTYLFLNGKQTSYDYPTKDVTYYGSAIIGKNGEYRMLEKSVKADLNLQENTLDITIKPSNTEKLNVKADVKSHKSGRSTTYSFNGENTTIKVQGGFFGKEDVGGIFEVLDGTYKDENGVFGASANEQAKQAHPVDF